jgi:hypothetical protein
LSSGIGPEAQKPRPDWYCAIAKAFVKKSHKEKRHAGGNGNDASGVPTELFPGRVDELMSCARALSATEIAPLPAGALFPAGCGFFDNSGADLTVPFIRVAV